MASGPSGEGIDSIEFESTVSHNVKNIDALSIARTSDDNEKDRLSSMDDKSGYQDGGRHPGHRYAKSDKERKIGHRRVGEGGEVTYKKIQTSQIMGSIQLGIQHTVGSLASKPKRDLLMMDFWEIESISFPPEGSNLTPAHHYSEFRFKIYAPIAFRYFRDLFGIQPDDFMMSMCSAPLRELSNPGASGSIFYLTDDDEFIIKTVQHKEGEFLQKLLPGYYMNLNQNPRTLLPKFFGLYCFQCNSKNVRLVVMNNLLPSYVKMHLKYDLKGSTYKRKASKAERSKSSPTYKDLDFMEHHPNGIFLEADTYNALIKTIQRDCTVLESFKIMDYSLLVGIHNLDLALKEKQEEKKNNSNFKSKSPKHEESDLEDAPEADQYIAQEERERGGATALNRSRSINRQRLVAHSTAMESIQAESEPIDEEEDVPITKRQTVNFVTGPGGIPARSEKGERLLLFIGVIDILQSYRLKKKLEHTLKSIIHDGDTVSVCRPSFYAQRFQNFMAKTVFKKIPSPLKHSPSKRKSLSRAAQRSVEAAEPDILPTPGSSHHHHHHHHHMGSTSQKAAVPISTASQLNTMSSATTKQTNKPITNVTGVGSNVSAIKQKTTITKSKVPPPVPPRGSPKVRKGTAVEQQQHHHNQQQQMQYKGTENILGASNIITSSTNAYNEASPSGTAPSCCSTPPPAFDDISEESSQRQHVDDRCDVERRVQLGSAVRSTYKEDTVRFDRTERSSYYVSVSEIRLDSHLSVETSSNSQYSSRGALAWTPPASVEGSTPTWTEGTPSFTDSSSSGELENASPLNVSSSDKHKATVEDALNSITSEMVSDLKSNTALRRKMFFMNNN